MTTPTKPTVPATFEEWWKLQYKWVPSHAETAMDAWCAATAAQAEKLRIAVEALEKVGYLSTGGEDLSYLGRIAREALAKLKEDK